MRKIFSFSTILFLFTCSYGSWEYVGGFKGPYLIDNSEITFPCSNAVVKIGICADDIFRIRMSREGNFVPDEPYVVIQYDWPGVDYNVEDQGDFILVTTRRVELNIRKEPFGIILKDLSGRVILSDASDGGMGWDGERIICRKVLTESDHFFGLGQRYEKSDMRGETRDCWVTREETHVPFFMGTDGYGIFFHNTWRSEYDFTKNPYTFSAPGGEMDYYLIYGPDFKHILGQYTEITGKSPLPPKWAFGFFLSKWDEKVNGIQYIQDGQDGLLSMVRSAREMWDWPLDGIRVHSKGCDQNFYAGGLAWADDGWGEFPNIKEMLDEMHAMNCHVLFWETPGVPQCSDMYKEGMESNYFLLEEDGIPWIGEYGYTAPHGSLVDFSNPEARRWWGEHHYFMVDAGSDGVAGDWHSVVEDNLFSPYSKMLSDESRNLFSLLFNQASYDAYRERNPEKRCITFGLIYWAGGQRYPMHGTQDSHHSGMNIEGEMMGCINLGLSGIPFRIYTDNVTREIDPRNSNTRLSQYMALTVAGERTLTALSGNKVADQNYRFYGKLKYQLMPYVYTYAREAARTGLPLVRSMVLEYQNDPGTYSAYGQYLMGEDLLIAPLWSDTTFYRDIYLPEGEWIDFFDETVYQGMQTISYHAPIDRAPILIRSGAIIPMAPEGQRYVDDDKSHLNIHIYPGDNNTFELYEDDGVSYDYEKGVYSVTRFSCEQTRSELLVKKSKPEGKYNIPERDHIFCIHKIRKVNSVIVNGAVLAENRDKLKDRELCWFIDHQLQKLWISIPGGANQELTIRITGTNE